jgi:cell division protein FtsQ
MKKVMHIVRWVAGVALVFTLLVAAVTTSQDAVLKDVVVNIDYVGENFFIEQEEIEESVFDLGYHRDSTLMMEIDPSNIEHLLENNAYISDAEVYKELNGKLHIDVSVRKPIIRVYNDLGFSVYIDQDGHIMPLSSKYASRTPIANGNLTMMLGAFIGENVYDLEKNEAHPEAWLLSDIYEVAATTAKDEFWKAQCNQIYINRDHEIEMIPRVGDHQILLGSADGLEKKLNKLKLFYEEGLSKTGWNEYKNINLKYTNQVVCEKR